MVMVDEQLLDKYAELAVNVGANLREGQRLLIAGVPPELAPLVRLITKHAYLAGARLVDVDWFDEELDRIRLQYAAPETLQEFPEWIVQLNLDYFKKGDASLAVIGDNPDLMAGQDPQKLETVQKVRVEKMAPVFDEISAATSNWSLIAGSTTGWAQKVFPDLEPEAAVARLWEAIFDICRVRSEDPVAAWRQHISDLQLREDYLGAKSYRSLHFKAPGTDLLMGLPDNHLWSSGAMLFKNGISAVVNIPTEEVFTLPQRDRIDGIVSSTKPLSYNGSLIENLTLTFANGHVVKATAEKGQATVNTLLDMDEGARSLGEIALVPHSSPISQSNLLFYNTLYDENASSHMALGSAYMYSLQGGTEMSEEAFKNAGGNTSQIHVDFMVGSGEMSIDGILADDTAEPVMRYGEWAFDV